MEDMVIKHAQKGKTGAWSIELEGRRVGKMAYSERFAGTITILHTEVGPELRGRGAGLKLVEAGVVWAREHQKKVDPQCPFARATLMKHPELQDVLAEPIG